MLFSKEEKKYFSIIHHQNNENENHSEIPLHFYYNGYHFFKSTDEDIEKLEPSYTVSGLKIESHDGRRSVASGETNTLLSFDPVLDICPEK